MKVFKNIFIVLVLSVFLSSCASAVVRPIPGPIYKPAVPAVRANITHTVAPGETIWRISKMYDVSMDNIIEYNNIKRVDDLKMGERLVIPHAAPIKPVITLYPSRKWKYIIIHHSATDEGNAFCFYNSHRKRGWKDIGYHFVIDNGTKGKTNGQIETTSRWLKQQNGAHCKANSMNSRGIGVCLVGNYSEERLSTKQLDSLVYLVNTLRKYYKVPMSNILGHGQVKGARTECPGKLFPWAEFRRRLSE
ncbi:MAG: N-acetylmuramoyl-L-alanine amidase [Candidatus Gygaella obscura]|nr:N-acetylmuramoyl-L-alanine amidase [Candidatus Gygaella obscura]